MVAASLCACSSARAPVDQRGEEPVRDPARPGLQAPIPAPEAAPPPVHQVAKGDTLYSIAWRYGMDYRDIARWNDISDPFVIIPGQRLVLRAGKPADRPAASAPPPRVTAEKTAPAAPPTTAPVPPSAASRGAVHWQWPTSGRIVRSDSPTSKKGVDISGIQGQPVNAAAAGAVVYSGSGLLGYGRLIILKHSDTFLSAYAYNERLLVAEGDQVSAGQQIATMGMDNDGRSMLHFEIRKDGKPVNPLDHLPREQQVNRS
ncbi:MAG: peptidoglycan DD-metalloendopeptidase family protein [Gammaproteobacteria bacterium]|nr:peptidoglycan DD-metalloendopeptidase family protein [Gammaproteobacteria bacterium]